MTLILTSGALFANKPGLKKEGNVITKEGAWCWFADPRALHYQNADGTINSSYIGYIDVHGNIKAMQYNFLTGKSNEVLIRSYFQPDDHNNPSFLVLPDERIMIFYSRHTDEACFYYRISKKTGDITTLGDEMKIITTDNTTYPSPFILSDDPAHFYLCWRGINWHPTIGRFTLPDSDDRVNIDLGPFQVIQSTGARPYCKYCSDGKSKIYFTYTTGHPDNEYPNFLYLNYIDINSLQLKDISGTILSELAGGPHHTDKKNYAVSHPNAVVDAPDNQRDWVWQTALDKDGMPVIAMVRISDDKTMHNYYYAKWTGSEWRKTFLAGGGGHFHQSPDIELCYSGGMAIDDSFPNIVYCSVPADGTSGKVYELMKYTIADDGSVAASEQITTNSALNNVRPYVISHSGNSPMKLLWMHGNYYDWIVSSARPLGFSTSIHSNFAIAEDSINLKRGLIFNKNFKETVSETSVNSDSVLHVTKDSKIVIPVKKTKEFSISLNLYINEKEYEGVILKMGSLVYGLDKNTLRTYITIDSITYQSTNMLATSDVWKTKKRGTGGEWYTPVKLSKFNIAISYGNNKLTVYRDGLIDQVAEVKDLVPEEIIIGGFEGSIENCHVYNRVINQSEVKKMTD